jgi:hypothetical protein
MLFLLGLGRHLDNHHMKTSALRFSYGGLAFCLCLVFSSFAARCQPTYGGITAKSGVNLQGNNITLDSFNSADSNHSIWQTGMTYHGMPYGVYSDSLSYNSNPLPSRTSDFTLATDGSIINVGDAQIYGFINTAPGGSASINRNGSVGDLNWVSSTNTGIEQGHEEDDMDAVFVSESLPTPITASQTTWWPVPAPPGGTNIGGVTYLFLITNQPANSNFVYYSMGELDQNIFIDASNVVLYLTNGLSFHVYNLFTLNSNADVSIYSSGDMGIYGGAAISNLTQNAHALSIYDVAGHTNLMFSFGGAGFGPAFVYAPSSSVSLGGGGIQDFIGAIFCNEITVPGHINLHYDESLSSESLPFLPWIIEQPTNQTVLARTSANFNVVAGGGPTAYQWYFSQGAVSNAIVGATNASLTITNVPLTDAGSYSVVVGNAFGARVSSQASLTVNPNPAAILSVALNPTNQQVYVEVNGFTGAIYALQFSTNLTDWVTVWYGEGSFTNVDLNDSPQRYYRAVFDP